MRILTVRQPWAWAIIHGGKTVENRVRNIAGGYRGPVAIHAAKGLGPWNETEGALQAVHLLTGVDARPQLVNGPRGAIIGAVDLVGVHSFAECDRYPVGMCSPWAEPDAWHMVLANPRPLAEPIPYRGALGLRNLAVNDPATTAQILAQIGAAA